MDFLFGSSAGPSDQFDGNEHGNGGNQGADDGMLAMLVDRLESSTSTADILESLQEMKVRPTIFI